jgi:hypothetical protein
MVAMGCLVCRSWVPGNESQVARAEPELAGRGSSPPPHRGAPA